MTIKVLAPTKSLYYDNFLKDGSEESSGEEIFFLVHSKPDR